MSLTGKTSRQALQDHDQTCTLCDYYYLENRKQNYQALIEKMRLLISCAWHWCTCMCMSVSIIPGFCNCNCHQDTAAKLIWFPLRQAGAGLKQLGRLIKQCSHVLPSPLWQQHNPNATRKNTQAKPVSGNWIGESHSNLRNPCETSKCCLQCKQYDSTVWCWQILMS